MPEERAIFSEKDFDQEGYFRPASFRDLDRPWDRQMDRDFGTALKSAMVVDDWEYIKRVIVPLARDRIAAWFAVASCGRVVTEPGMPPDLILDRIVVNGTFLEAHRDMPRLLAVEEAVRYVFLRSQFFGRDGIFAHPDPQSQMGVACSDPETLMEASVTPEHAVSAGFIDPMFEFLDPRVHGLDVGKAYARYLGERDPEIPYAYARMNLSLAERDLRNKDQRARETSEMQCALMRKLYRDLLKGTE